MNAVSEMPTALIFTDAAANKVKELIDEYCGSDPELVGALTFSELSLRILQVGVISDLTPLRRHGDRVSAFIGKYRWSFSTSGTLIGRHSRTAAPTSPEVTEMRRMGACAEPNRHA